MSVESPRISYLADSLPPKLSLPPGPPLARPLRYLIVDDSRATRAIIREELEPTGAEIAECASGLEAITVAQSFRPDAITLDVVMPDLDGYAVCARLKRDEATMSIPVVIVASAPASTERPRAFLAGAAEYYPKPFARGALRELLDQLMGRLRAHRHQRVLLALDNLVETVHVESTLVAHGYECESFTTPRAAVEALAGGGNLLILDVDFATADGIEALLRARDRAALARTPIVALVSESDRLRTAVAFNAGAADVIRRPFFPEELVARVENLLRVASLERRLVEEATIDSLTGLFNRRHLARLITVELKRAARHGEPLGILIADLDHFKQVNDTHGHGVGDEVLRATAREMALHIRATDVATRYGGEEFVFILPGDREVGLRVVAERIRMHVEALRIATSHGPLNVTVSLGGTWWEPESTNQRLTLQELLRPADQALYAAKAEGRNRCIVVTSSGRRRGVPLSTDLDRT